MSNLKKQGFTHPGALQIINWVLRHPLRNAAEKKFVVTSGAARITYDI